MSQTVRPDVYAGLSRELALALAADGTIRWLDPRASSLLERKAGDDIRSVVAPGTEDKLERLLTEGRTRVIEGWELLLRAGGQPTTVAVRTMPYEDGLLMVASLVSADYGRLLGAMGETMNELSALHRESERQQRLIVEQRETIASRDRDLAESDRGMVALHGELDETTLSLRQVSESRASFIASLGHELRTPLNAILGLTKLLLSETDGELNQEQEKQIGFIRKSADTLSELVNDLLDLGRIDAGKLQVRARRFDLAELFAALRGMTRPLLTSDRVRLVFEDPASSLPTLDTDDGKLAQILRNYVSNAIKFTTEGEIRVSVRAEGSDRVRFTVQDTGIGIAPRDLDRLFEEFVQLDSPLQRMHKGTGLGLSITKRLATLLGGEVGVESAPGKGSTFWVTIPVVHEEVRELDQMKARSSRIDPARHPVLVVEDDRQQLFLYEKYLEGSGYQIIPARSIEDARAAIEQVRPSAIVLDVMLEGETSWRFLTELKSDPRTRDIPTLVVTVIDRERQARALGADEFFVKPIEGDWLLKKLKAMSSAQQPVERVLVIDDDEVARYLVRRLLADTPYSVLEATDGPEGIKLAREALPHVILLDFVMPQMSAFDVIDELKADPATRGIPVIIATSKNLDEEERARLAAHTAAIVSKDKLSREVAITRIREALSKALPAGAGRR
ncbi:MAG TPA: ATP-binding protein [Gemmatimonadaceae bacterium]